jgi:dolichyl-phosphate-mannose--protein O-mannosyl transferase
MKKTKQVLAMIGVILLLLLYASTLFFALTASEQTMNLLMASIVATILIPIVCFLYARMVDIYQQNKGTDNESK